MTPARLALLAALLVAGGVRAEEFRLLRLDGLAVKWNAPALGAPARVTWALAGPQAEPGLRNCRGVGPLDAAAADRVRRAAAPAFAMWTRAVGVAFRPAAAGERPDIVIGAQPGMRRAAYADVVHDRAAAQNGVAPLTHATICLDPEADWGRGLDLATVLAHEIGHAIGLDHPGATGALMGWENQGALGGLLAGDVAGGRALYGAPPAWRASRAE